jgi:hypothetical protein
MLIALGVSGFGNALFYDPDLASIAPLRESIVSRKNAKLAKRQ